MNLVKSMKSKAQSWFLATLTGLLLMAIASPATAQTQDWPTHKGGNARVGNNGNPTADNAGAAVLKWFQPNPSTGIGEVIVRTDASSEASSTGVWNSPFDISNVVNYFINFTPNALIGVNTLNPVLAANAIPSDMSGDPRVPLASFAGQLSVFTWQLTPPTNTPRDYALFVDIPTGYTLDGAGNATYASRYYVFEIDYGTNQQYLDVVDRANISGFIRLGNGGGPSSVLFHYDGITPIRIRLFNTIPRNSAGQLDGVGRINPVTGAPFNNFNIYANAAKATVDYGANISSPIIGTDAAGTKVFQATNLNVHDSSTGTTQQQGVVNALNYLTGAPIWTFLPNEQGNLGLTIDNLAASVTHTPGWQVGNNTVFANYQGYIGPNYLYETVTATAGTQDIATYAPTLAQGAYDILMWTPGTPTAPPTFAQAVQVEIDEGANATIVNVDLTQSDGYIHLGNRQFVNTPQNPLVVKITNLDTNVGDAGKLAYADSIRFVGARNLAIDSTPAQATVPITYRKRDALGNPVTTTANIAVVVVAGDDGRLYCLDAAGRGDGTTDIYWAYPSIPDPNNPAWTDPNNTGPGAPDGSNGVTIAEMPTGFDLSSALIQQVNGVWTLYILGNNGRVYAIDMQGRGDNLLDTRTVGTTRRDWTYPDDYRPDNPSILPKPTSLGGTNASLVYHTNAAGPTIFVPTAQGRMYALDAGGNTTSTTTTVRWAYPALTAPTLGPINSTPALDGAPATLYFGTERKNGTELGQFISLDAETGTLNWSLTSVNGVPFDDFEGGPATAFNNLVGDGRNYIYAANQNGHVFAVDNTGALLWDTTELNSGVVAPLTFTDLTVFNNLGVATALPVPTVLVPTADGHVQGLFGAVAGVNKVGTKLDYGIKTDGDVVYSAVSSGHQFQFTADNHGYIYGNNGGSPGGVGGIAGPSGYADVGVPNDPEAGQFANAKHAFYLAASYDLLRKDPAPNYATYTAASNFLVRSPAAFEFGETVYLFVYDFPYLTNGQVNFTINVEGRTQRLQPVQMGQFSSGGSPATDGYAILVYPIQPGGGNSIAPGDATISWTFQGNSAESGNPKEYVANPGTQSVPFTIANPLGIAMQIDPATGYGKLKESLGADPAAFAGTANPQNAFNGSPSYATSSVGWNPATLLSSAGLVSHASTASATVWAYDRSLLAVLNGPDVPSISDMRLDRTNFAWQGGYDKVVKPFGGPNGLYNGTIPILEAWEDYPTQFPNISLDYPDIQRQYLTATKEPQGPKTENPVFFPSELEHPHGLFVLDANGNETNQPVPQSQWPNRTPNPTPIVLSTAVPRFQPANLETTSDSAGNNPINDGYNSLLDVFTDSNNSGRLILNGSQRGAYRSFNHGFGVSVDEHISVLTPNVDLGSLPEGSAILPAPLVNSASVRSPWADLGLGANRVYQPFQAVNDGNVNMLNVRVAKAYTNANGTFGWPFFGSTVDDLGWLDGSVYMYSDLDPVFSPSVSAGLTRGEVFVQKSRPNTVAGTRLVTNPYELPNANLGNTGNLALTNAFPAGLDPHVAVMPPIGFPVGQYQNNVDVIEDRLWQYPNAPTNYDLSFLQSINNNPSEIYADPTFTLSFTVREARLTNAPTKNDANMADVGPAFPLRFVDENSQPAGMRDRKFGNLLFGWVTNRPAINTEAEASATNYATRLYLANLVGTPQGLNGSPLNELQAWQPFSGTQWFTKMGPYPFGPSQANAAAVNTDFGAGAGEHVLGTVAGEEDTVRISSPAFSSTGLIDPLNSSPANDFGHALMAYFVSGQMQTPGGRVNESLLFVSTVTPQANTTPTISAPVISAKDVDTPKSKPSVVQVGADQAVILYGAGGTGRSRLFYTLYNAGTLSQTVPLDTGPGFDWVSDPSATARPYQGVDPTFNPANPNLMDLAFSGKLRGRSNAEIFLGRIVTDPNGAPVSVTGDKNLFYYFSTRFIEQLEAEPQRGLFRANGAMWNTANINNIDIGMATGNAAPVSIITGPTSSRILDPTTGILTLQTTMGTVYVDTFQGTVRFANTVPGIAYRVYATYQPRFLRLSQSKNTTLDGPQFLWDNRHVGSLNYDPGTGTLYDRYWYIGNAHDTLTDPRLLNSRYFALYNRAAVAQDQAARPLIESLRLGAQLPGPVATLPSNGAVDFTRFQVLGATGPYQVDPANGRVYFTALDEDRVVQIKNGAGLPVPYKIGLLRERDESPVTIEQAVNEGNVAAFLDPFDPATVGNRRPDLVWLLWNSTRAGTSDVYFETIAPLLWPVP